MRLNVRKSKLIRVSLILFLIIICAQFSFSQITIGGKVYDRDKNSVEYVAVVLKKDSVFLKSCFTDSLGNYKLTADKPGSYTLFFSYINYEIKELPISLEKDTIIPIYLESKNTTLKEVLIRGLTPIIKKEIDKIVFYPSTLISTSGNNAYETLKKSPSVFADEGGNISIRGLSGAGVMINGRLLQLSSEQIMDYLKSIPAEEIMKIEIISNPSSKYDADGLSGLINIVLKKNKKKGLTGNVNTSYEQNTYGKYSISTDINYRAEKINVFGGVLMRDGKYLLLENIDNIYGRNTSPYYYYEKGRRVRNETSNLNKLGIDYTINKNNLLGLRIEQNYTLKNGKQNSNASFLGNNSTIDSVYASSIDLKNYNNNIAANLNYILTLDTAGQSLSFDFDYINFNQPNMFSATLTEKYDGSFKNMNQNLLFKNTAFQKINIFSGKSDYSLPLDSNTWFESGIKYYYLNTNNGIKFYDFLSEWQLQENKSNDFNYNESNLALYATLQRKFSEKFSMQAGLRNENTFLNGNSSGVEIKLPANYSKIFPTIYVRYNKNMNNQFTLSYTKRISRPDYSNLNPFRFYVSPNNYIEGNPFLQPAFTNSLDASYLIHQKYYLNAFVYLTTGQITQVPILESINNSYKFSSINLDNSYNSGLNVYLPFEFKDWLRSSFSFTFTYNGVNSIINNIKYSHNAYTVQFATNNQVIISEKNKIYGELNAVYQPKGYTQGLFILGRMADLSLAFKKIFYDNKSSLTISVNDILNTAYITASVDKSNQYSYIYGNYDKRGVRISFSYKFGKRTIQEMRDKQSGVDTEKNRLSQ